jgi:hypothetical protein
MYAQTTKSVEWTPNNFNLFWSKKTKGLRHDNISRIWSSMPILNSTLQSTLHIYELYPSLIHSQTIDLLKTINLSILVSEEVISLNGLTSLSRSGFCFFIYFEYFCFLSVAFSIV